jgi:hypothetical protein
MLFKLLCSETLVFRTKVGWLSRGKFLTVVFELKMQLQLLFGLKQKHQ